MMIAGGLLAGWPAGTAWAGAVADAAASVVAVLPTWPGGYKRQRGTLEEPEGSAVAILPGGYLATNAHVLARASRVDVRLANGQLRAAIILGKDRHTDIALLKAPVNLPVPEIVAPPPPGQRACAIGNQFGLGISVTCGVISATRRTNAGFNPVEDFVQTDAAVNPGASGGALVDGRGRLVGLLSAIVTKGSDANVGVNFATSPALLMRVVTDLKAHGRVRFGKAGWQLASLNQKDRRKQSGVRVVKLDADGPAAAAGVQIGDVLTRVDARQVIRPTDAKAALFMYRPDEAAAVSLSRNGKRLNLVIKLRE